MHSDVSSAIQQRKLKQQLKVYIAFSHSLTSCNCFFPAIQAEIDRTHAWEPGNHVAVQSRLTGALESMYT